MTTPISEAKGVPPCQYSGHVEKTLAREAAWRAERRRSRWIRRLQILAIASAGFLLLSFYLWRRA